MNYMYILAILFLMIIVYTLVSNSNKIIEGATGKKEDDDFQPYSQDNPIILAQKNAANIQFIKGQLDQIYNAKTLILDISNAVALNTYNINQIADVAAHQAHQLTGTTPADSSNSSSESPTPSLST